MKINDELTVKIEDYDHEGRGIAIYDGFPIFIEKALLNETLLVTINYINSSYAKAYINKIVIPSPFRNDNVCPYYNECGGCNIFSHGLWRAIKV